MKFFTPLFIFFLLAVNAAISQVAINTDGSPADSTAMLDVKSGTKGLLIPRMSTTQRTAITTPTDGLLVYDSTTHSVWYSNLGTWQQVNANATFSLPYSGTGNSASPMLSLTNNGSGGALWGTDTSQAPYVAAVQGTISSATPGAYATAVRGIDNGTGDSSYGVWGSTNGPGVGVYGSTLGGTGVLAVDNGLGISGYGAYASSINGTGISGRSVNGVGVVGSSIDSIAGYFFNSNPTGPSPALKVFSPGNSGAIQALTSGSGNAVSAFGSGVGDVISVQATGLGKGLTITNSGFSDGLYVTNTNLYAGDAVSISNLSYSNGISIANSGYGNGIYISNIEAVAAIKIASGNGQAIYAASSASSAAQVSNSGSGNGVYGQTTSVSGNATAGVVGINSGPGYGVAGYINNDISGSASAVYGLVGQSGSTGYAGFFQNNNATSISPTLYVATNGTGNGLYVTSNNQAATANVLAVANYTSGSAGAFVNFYSGSGKPAVAGVTYGTGQALLCNQAGSSGDIAVFQTANTNEARIDRTGKGFFDGGTQNSGADLAEAVDVEGNFNEYEPGDVLEISASSDRTVVKCSSPYSTLVVGVYATKPGVLLTEDSLNSTATGKVPMGVVGIIPTKVCNENGAIARGDLLVTSSRPGYAMKADVNKVKIGQVLGKAMQSFDGETGKIKVLVNVR